MRLGRECGRRGECVRLNSITRSCLPTYELTDMTNGHTVWLTRQTLTWYLRVAPLAVSPAAHSSSSEGDEVIVVHRLPS